MSHQSTTTSIRLNPKLRDQLEEICHTLHRGKNWVIVKAVEEFISRFGHPHLKEEARKQSLLASKADKKTDAKAWEDSSDTSGWV